MENKKKLTLLIISSSLLWGLLLNGFFLYLPYLAQARLLSSIEVVISLSWITLCVFAVLIGKFYFRILDFPLIGNLLLGLVFLLGLAGLLLLNYFNSAWGWLLLTASSSIALSLLLSMAVTQSATAHSMSLSAWLGASPLIGTLVVSLIFSSQLIQVGYGGFLSVLSLVVSIWVLRSTKQVEDSEPEVKLLDIAPNGLLFFGFLLGTAVALLNTYVYQRISETVIGEPAEVAQLGSILIAIASLAGILASLSVRLRQLLLVPKLRLAQIAAAFVALGALVLVFANGVALIAVSGLLIGAGFGLANGLEVNLVQGVAGSYAQKSELFGRFLAATTIPYVLASALGIALFSLGLGALPVIALAMVLATVSIPVIRGK